MAGSVEKRGKDSWRLVVSIGYDQNGKQIKKTKTVKASKKRDAEKMLAQFVTEIEAGEYISPQKMKLVDFIDEWKEKYAKKHLATNTYEKYLELTNKRIIPSMGHMRIDQVKPIHILKFIKELEEQGARWDGKEGGLSSASIKFYHRILQNIFSRAVEWQIISSNPVSQVKKPRIIQKEVDVYNKEQILLLLTCLEKASPNMQLMIKIAISTGLRRGELIALEWKHVDFEKGLLRVDQSISYTKSKGIEVGPPKTKSSRRSVSIPEPLIYELETRYREALRDRNIYEPEELWGEGKHFFIFAAAPNGRPYHPSSVYTWWRRFLERKKLPFIKFHALRHTSATLLINEGAHVKIISSRLGHASISTTMNIYGHTLEDADRSAANLLSPLLKRV